MWGTLPRQRCEWRAHRDCFEACEFSLLPVSRLHFHVGRASARPARRTSLPHWELEESRLSPRVNKHLTCSAANCIATRLYRRSRAAS
jgi:hypothetical protein